MTNSYIVSGHVCPFGRATVVHEGNSIAGVLIKGFHSQGEMGIYKLKLVVQIDRPCYLYYPNRSVV